MGYEDRKLTRVPLLNARHRLLHLSYARDHISWTLDNWRTVICSDVSRLQLVRADVRLRVRPKSLDALNPSCEQDKSQAGDGSIKVYCIFTWRGQCLKVKLKGTFTGNNYV